jgi:hypothetical protein
MPANRHGLGGSSSLVITDEGSLPCGRHGSELELGKMDRYSNPVYSFWVRV